MNEGCMTNTNSFKSVVDDGKKSSNSKTVDFPGGGKRNNAEGKPDFSLILDSTLSYESQAVYRWAMRMTEGAKNYGTRNYEDMKSMEALERAKSSLMRHTIQFMNDEVDEDHLAAIMCNVQIIVHIQEQLEIG